MLYSPVKFRLTVVKLYNHDPNDTKDIVYTKGPARPSRLEVRIPAAPTLLAAIIPIAEISSTIPTAAILLITLAAAIYPSPATRSDQVRLVLLSLPLVYMISDVIINKDQKEALINAIASNTIINISFLTAKE